MMIYKWYGFNNAGANCSLFQKKFKYIQTIGVSSFSPQTKTSKHFGWLRAGVRVLYNIGPAPNRDGVIEAVARTAIMGFREDISIRVRKAGNIVRVDLRSASRYGQRDFGTNARRIESFLALLADARRRPR